MSQRHLASPSPEFAAQTTMASARIPGFESRGSRKLPADQHLLSPPEAGKTAGFLASRAHPAPEIAGQSRLERLIPARGMTGELAGRLLAAGCRHSLISSGFRPRAQRGACFPRRSRVASYSPSGGDASASSRCWGERPRAPRRPIGEDPSASGAQERSAPQRAKHSGSAPIPSSSQSRFWLPTTTVTLV